MKTLYTHILFKKIIFGMMMLCFVFKTEAQDQDQCMLYLHQEESTYYITNTYQHVVNKDLIKPGSWAADFADLSVNQRLMSQTDDKLKAFDLVLEDGGICGPTCIGNIVASFDYHKSKRKRLYWVNNIHIFIDGLIRLYQEIAIKYNDPTGENPLRGIYTHFFADQFNHRNKDLGIKGYHIKGGRIGIVTNYHLRYGNNMVVGTVVFQDKDPSDNHAGHAIIILGIDNKNRHIALIDPNYPNEILVSAFIEEENGALIFSLNEDIYGPKEKSYVRLDEILRFEKDNSL